MHRLPSDRRRRIQFRECQRIHLSWHRHQQQEKNESTFVGEYRDDTLILVDKDKSLILTKNLRSLARRARVSHKNERRAVRVIYPHCQSIVNKTPTGHVLTLEGCRSKERARFSWSDQLKSPYLA